MIKSSRLRHTIRFAATLVTVMVALGGGVTEKTRCWAAPPNAPNWNVIPIDVNKAVGALLAID